MRFINLELVELLIFNVCACVCVCEGVRVKGTL